MKSRIGKAKGQRGKSENTHRHKEYVPEIIRKIISEADIILEVLDARFIEKTENHEIEKMVKDARKPIIYVFNKSDLIDVKAAEKETEILGLNPGLFFSSKKGNGLEELKVIIRKEIEKIERGKDEPVNIGIIGYPNTGKSSLINILVGRRVSRTSPEAGYTKGMQKLRLSEKVYLIDTPGIIPLNEKFSKTKDFVTKHSQIGAITWDKTKNPEMVINGIMNEYPNILENHYSIPANGDSEILIENLGRKLHFLNKGNKVDEVRTAKKILKDWQEGKITI